MLPKIDLPLFQLTLPSTGEIIKYRQYTVKEEKILLVAQESKDPSQEILAMKQVTNNCIMDKDVNELPMFDLEYIHLALRGKSVNNSIGFKVKDPDTEEEIELELDLDKVQLTRYDDHSNEIRINDDYILYLKYPNIDTFIKIVQMNPTDPLVNYMVMTSCLDKIASEDEVYDFKNYTEKEVDSFMENLQGDVIKSIQKFFETIPKLKHELPYKNKDGVEKTFVIEGIRTFFQ